MQEWNERIGKKILSAKQGTENEQGSESQKNHPAGAKALLILRRYGTTKVMPC
jgi:hypothetical protein